MSGTLVAMTSVTYAMKAKKLLDRKNIRCEITRTPKNIGSGCGYSLVVRDADAVLELLDKNRIPHHAAYQI